MLIQSLLAVGTAASCGTILNTTSGMCCSGSVGKLAPSFACNTTAACCAACFNNKKCTSWTLERNGTAAASSLCTLQSSCATTPGNCTRGELRPLAPTSAPTTPSIGLSFKFVATWRGLHNADVAVGEKVGDCTASLIAPQWIITAEHCTERILKHEKVKVKINFHGGKPHVERGVTHCVRSDGADVDVAICHLTARVGAFPPISVNPHVMKTGHKAVTVLTVGTMGGLHHPTKKLEFEGNGAHLHVTKGGGMKAGDSGGPWIMQENGKHYLVGVLHGSGIAGQTSFIRAFLDKHINGTNGEEIHWEAP